MDTKIKSLRSFIGSKEYKTSQSFYTQWGFQAIEIGSKMTYFMITESLGFYLQDFYIKDWVDNSMLFLEVDDLNSYQQELLDIKLKQGFPSVRISDIKEEDWGRVMFLHDPSGVLWQIGEFKKSS